MNQKTIHKEEEIQPDGVQQEQASGEAPAGDPNDDYQAASTGPSGTGDSRDDLGDAEGDLDQANRDDLIAMILESRQQLDGVREGYVRARAEVENIQRRSQNEIVAARKYAIEGFAQELLSVVDSLDQASRVELDDSAGEAVLKMREGLELTLKQLSRVMEKFGISAVEAAPGVKFDPELHQAVSMVPGGDIPPDHIVDVMQQGFMLKDRLLRPAMVMIAAA